MTKIKYFSPYNLSTYRELIKDKNNEVFTIEQGNCFTRPAKLGFYRRLVNFITGNRLPKINAQTRAAFNIAIDARVPKSDADSIRKKLKFNPLSTDELFIEHIKKIISEIDRIDKIKETSTAEIEKTNEAPLAITGLEKPLEIPNIAGNELNDDHNGSATITRHKTKFHQEIIQNSNHKNNLINLHEIFADEPLEKIIKKLQSNEICNRNIEFIKSMNLDKRPIDLLEALKNNSVTSPYHLAKEFTLKQKYNISIYMQATLLLAKGNHYPPKDFEIASTIDMLKETFRSNSKFTGESVAIKFITSPDSSAHFTCRKITEEQNNILLAESEQNLFKTNSIVSKNNEFYKSITKHIKSEHVSLILEKIQLRMIKHMPLEKTEKWKILTSIRRIIYNYTHTNPQDIYSNEEIKLIKNNIAKLSKYYSETPQ